MVLMHYEYLIKLAADGIGPAGGRSDCQRERDREAYRYHLVGVTTSASPMPTPQQTSVKNITRP